MTTLEIKRLDSSSNGVSPPPPPPSSSTSASAPNGISSLSSSLSTQRLQRIATKNGDEIPIDIVKSPSYIAGGDSGTVTRASSTTTTTTRSPTLSKTSSSGTGTVGVGRHPPNDTATATPTPLAPSSIGNNSSSQMSQLNDSSDLASKVLNVDTLRFNKYGFANPAEMNVELDAGAGKGSADAAAAATSSSTFKSEKSSTMSGGGGGGPSSTHVPNLKDYLQTADVEQFAEQLPIKVVQERELKWVDMLANFDEWMAKRFKKIKSRCRKGIPQSMRSKAWMHLTGAFVLKAERPGYYAECCANVRGVDVARYVEDIKKDLHRQFPSHELFMRREGRDMLYNVLRAYAVHNPAIGYCQAQGPIAALLLMHMPEEDAFWLLIRVSDFYLKEYFKPGLEKVQIDGQALFYLFKRENAAAHKLMRQQSIDPILYMTEWFMCIYARTLPWCTVLRVWDMFFCEGIKVLYRVGLYLLSSAFEGAPDSKRIYAKCQQQGMYETLSLLRNLPIECLKEATLVRDSCAIKVNELELSKAFDKSRVEFVKQAEEMNANRKKPPASSTYKNDKKKS